MATSTKVPAAIVGPGNIGTDLMMKLLRSEVIEPRYMVGVDPSSEGLRLAERAGLETSADGVDWLLARPELPAIVFEATSAYVHVRNAPRYAAAGIRAVDLTPAARGPYVVPPVNLARAPRAAQPQHGHLRRPGHDPRSCTRSAASSRSTTRRSWRRWPRRRPGRAPVPTSTSSPARRPGPWRCIGGATRGKAIIILNPADPPLIMRDTIYCSLPADADHGQGRRLDPRHGGRGADVRPRLPPPRRAAVRPDGRRQRAGGDLPGGRRARATTCRPTPATSTS